MATIVQAPLYELIPVGSELIYVVENFNIVSTKTKVKFIAEVYISEFPIVTASETPIGTFKTTPNNAGNGIFDFRPIVENFVNADNLGGVDSAYKLAVATVDSTHPLHLIDKFSTNKNTFRYVVIVFKTEYLDTLSTPNAIVLDGTESTSLELNIFNGYLKYTDELSVFQTEFGYDTTIFHLNPSPLPGDVPAKLLTNAPMQQFATENDYGTISFYNKQFNLNTYLYLIKIYYTELDGTTTLIMVDNKIANGGFNPYITDAKQQILYFGCYPANIRNWDVTFHTKILNGTIDFYTVQGFNNGNEPLTEELTIKLICPKVKGYEPIRLAWLNQWGAWDYYTFNMKSTKMISTKGSTYQQLSGTWNEYTYKVNGFKGGKKAFRVNAKEKIKMNTDFVSEAESEWFEELINSPEVYILEGYKTDITFPNLNTYVTPVRLTTSSFTRKTVANDKLMQYTFEVEKSKTLRTQSV